MFKRALAAVATAGLLVALTPGVSSATVTSVPIPGTPSFDGSVDVVAHDGSTVYVAGEFTHVTDTARTVTRPGVAAFDADSGLVKAWRPAANGLVRSMAVTSRGVYLGGDFTHVGPQKRLHVALVSGAGKGKLAKFRSRVKGGTVNAVAVRKKTVYLGGAFSRVNGTPRDKLAAVAATSGELRTGWAPMAQNGVVNDLVAKGPRVYVAGEFRMLNGDENAARLAALTRKKGRIDASFDPVISRQIIDIAVTRDSVYAAVGGLFGGSAWRVARDTGATAWSQHLDGDAQAVTVLGSDAYFGGHFGAVCDDGNQSASGNCQDGFTTRGQGASFNIADGALTSWNPQLNGRLGIRGATQDAGRVIVVGDFTTANNGAISVPGLAMYGAQPPV